MIASIGMDTFSRTAGMIALLALFLCTAIVYLRPAIRKWLRGEGSFPALGLTVLATAVLLTVVGFGYVQAFKSTNPPERVDPSERERRIRERSREVIPVKAVQPESLKDKSREAIEAARQQNEERKQRFRELPDRSNPKE